MMHGKKRVCRLCDKRFLCAYGNQQYCSTKCSKKIKSLWYSWYMQTPKGREEHRKNSRLYHQRHRVIKICNKKCLSCKRTLPVFPVNRKFCSKECLQHKKKRKVTPLLKSCLFCTKRFKTNRKQQKYCCFKHSQLAYYQRNKQRCTEYARRRVVSLRYPGVDVEAYINTLNLKKAVSRLQNKLQRRAV